MFHCGKPAAAIMMYCLSCRRFIDEMPQEDIKILGRKGGEPIVSKEEGRSHLAGMLNMLAEKGRKI